MVNLSRVNVARIVMAIQGLSLVALVWLARRPAGRLSSWRLRLEWALFLMAMLWFMPVMRAYHVIWAYPAVAVLAGAVHYHGLRHWWSLMTLATLALAAAVQVMSAVPAEGALPWLPPPRGRGHSGGRGGVGRTNDRANAPHRPRPGEVAGQVARANRP